MAKGRRFGRIFGGIFRRAVKATPAVQAARFIGHLTGITGGAGLVRGGLNRAGLFGGIGGSRRGIGIGVGSLALGGLGAYALSRKLRGKSLIPSFGHARPGGFRGGGRVGRRHRGGITMSEMGKLTYMSQILGKRNPAVTLMVMKAMGGRL